MKERKENGERIKEKRKNEEKETEITGKRAKERKLEK